MKIKYCTIYFVFILCFNSVFSQTSSGEILLDGIISAENNQIKNIADPSELQDAVTKNYLNDYINKIQVGNQAAFHSLSEAYGFILSLQFTNDGYDSPYFSNNEVNEMLSNVAHFCTVNESDIFQMIQTINARFNF